MTDRELLEAAAKAAGMPGNPDGFHPTAGFVWVKKADGVRRETRWNPLTDDGDALRLAVKLKMRIAIDSLPTGFVAVYPVDSMTLCTHEPIVHDDTAGATRRAIVRAAATMAQTKETP